VAASDVFLLASQFLAAALFLLLAGLLLVVRFNSRVYRAFAIFLLLRGAALLLQQLARLPSNEGEAIATTLSDVARAFVLVTPLVILYFVVLYRSPHGGIMPRATGAAALLVAIVVELLYLMDHCTYSCDGDYGILVPLVQGLPLAQGLAALALAWNARATAQPQRRPVTVVAAAFALLGLLEGAQVISLLLADGVRATFDFAGQPWLAVARIGVLTGFLAALLAVVVLVPQLHVRGRWLLLASAAVVVATTLYQLHLEDQVTDGTSQALSVTTGLFGAWRLLAVALVAYALVRHRFLDLDLQINWTISRGTVLAIFVATFLVVSKIIENALNSRLGIIFGGVATGLLMLAIKPLERLGDKVAGGVHPRGRPQELEEQQRIALFQEQALLVWADGHIGRKERLLLDNLRDRLSLDPRVAAQIEHEAAMTSGPNASPPGLST
jgi:hypothetical protein